VGAGGVLRGETASAPGSRLGLAIAAQQASLHGGEIKVADSSLGGARFEVWLTATDRTNPVTSSALHEPSVDTPSG
jgi:two-component system sensor histidine kinase PrrB